jgi:hypothetical protein
MVNVISNFKIAIHHVFVNGQTFMSLWVNLSKSRFDDQLMINNQNMSKNDKSYEEQQFKI